MCQVLDVRAALVVVRRVVARSHWPLPAACKGCGDRHTSWRKRGICHHCYRSPRLRRQHDRGTAWGFDSEGQQPEPRRASAGGPGSGEKIADMAARYQAREQLHSDADPTDQRSHTHLQARRAAFLHRLGLLPAPLQSAG